MWAERGVDPNFAPKRPVLLAAPTRTIHSLKFRSIERQYPGIVYKIQLKKSEEKRLADFARATAFADYVDPRSLDLPTTKSKSFEALIQVLQQLNSFLGDRKMK